MEEDKSKPKAQKLLGLGFQMIATIGLGTYLGYLLDEKLEVKNYWFTISFCMASFAAFMIYLVKKSK